MKNDIKILYIDDDETLHELFYDVLKDSNYGIKTVSSGEAALELLKTFPADIIFTDQVMPGLSGDETPEKNYDRLSRYFLLCSLPGTAILEKL